MGFQFVDFGPGLKQHLVQDGLVDLVIDDAQKRHAAIPKSTFKGDTILLGQPSSGYSPSDKVQKLRVSGVRFDVVESNVPAVVRQWNKPRDLSSGVKKVYFRNLCIVMTSTVYRQIGSWLVSVGWKLDPKTRGR